RKVKAGGGSVGVFKRNKRKRRLDPSYDPAAIKPGAGRTTAAAVGEPASGNELPEEAKKLKDWIKFKGNIDKEIRCTRLPPTAKVTLDFDQAPLGSITKLMSCWLDRNFLVASNRRGAKVTIISPQPVTVYEAWRAYLSALHVNGMSLTKRGNFFHIVDANKARANGARVLGLKGRVPDDDRIVTRLLRLEHTDAKQMVTLLSKFKGTGGDIFTIEGNNTLVITDTGSNIRRMMRLLKNVDVPLGKEKIWIRPVQHMQASELVEKINAVFAEGGKSRGRRSRRRGKRASTGGGNDITRVQISKVIADERTNQIIMITTRSSYLKVDRLIRKLDVPIPGEGQIHIHSLENADAEDLAQTLQSLAGGGGGGRSSRGRSRGRSKRKSSKGGSAALFEGEVKITAHKATNSLVIEASLKDYLSLQRVIQRLDRRRKQVYVEAVIMEISTTKNRTMQIAGSAGTTFDIGGDEVPLLLGLGGLGMGGVDISQLNSGGLAAGLQGPLLQLNTGNTGSASVASGVTLSIPAFGFLIQAIQENSDVNVLSTPHILTLNNEEAEIQVGRKVPYRQANLGGGMGGLGGLGGLAGGLAGGASGALGALGGLGGLGGMMGGMGSMIQFIDVDLTLKIKPQINENNFIKLKIDQKLDEIEAMDPNLGPTTSKRKITNTVVVRDQQPVVIGGLIQDRETTGVAKIPLLGDLPLIGILFRKSTKRVEKKNLLLIVVPHIIKDPSDIRRLHDEKMAQLRRFAEDLATKRKEYKGQIDYRKKTGLLQRIYAAVEKSKTQRKLMEKAYYDNANVDIVGPPEHHDLEHDPFAAHEKKLKAQSRVEVIDLPKKRKAKVKAKAQAKPKTSK
ncbi:MAG: type II secretion system secretin GspD, partial [Myxococcales bacterium]|nr:type II secretion system secretin GspD [Myxococcales bacterium]